jgi:hypothetical protein
MAVPLLPACAVPGSCFAPRQAGFAVTSFTAVCPATPGRTSLHRASASHWRASMRSFLRRHVPVDDQAASLAREDALIQGQLGFHHPTGRAGLQARKESVGDDEPAATPAGLVAELPAQLTEGTVSKAFEPTSGGPDEAGFVGCPAVGDPGMEPRESPRALPPVGRALLLAAVRATGSAQPPERRPQWPRSRDLDHPPTMVHGGHQGFETDIDPDRRPRSGMPIGDVTVDLHRERHGPALLRETVAERILALPSASLRASASVDS